jgi:hypothetical protein
MPQDKSEKIESTNPPPFPKLLLTASNVNPHSTISGAIHVRRKGARTETAEIAEKTIRSTSSVLPL